MQPDRLVAAFVRIPAATIGYAKDASAARPESGRCGRERHSPPMATVCTRAGDNLYIHKALDLAAAGNPRCQRRRRRNPRTHR
ncbi:hypothetical protein [Rhodococcus sp. ZPP]|uniref:hypothetical protein n=1 Tax=Rhodococcus sp. ZPP TaxID=2749906 RepID=UPI001FCE06C6|nr:hypothetical protein [Rhodococcus sp. ZPP]